MTAMPVRALVFVQTVLFAPCLGYFWDPAEIGLIYDRTTSAYKAGPEACCTFSSKPVATHKYDS